MKLSYIIPKALKKLLNPPALAKCEIDKTSRVCSRSELAGVRLGKYSYIGNSCFAVNADIGSFCSIADRVIIGGATHPMQRVSMSPVFHAGKNVLKKNFAEFEAIQTPKTRIGNDVWIGMNAVIKSGVTIGNGAVIGAGSVVTCNITPYTIGGGYQLARENVDLIERQF